MITLNIIPRELKNEIRLEQFFNSLKKILYILLIILIAYSIGLLLIKLVLQIYFVKTVEQTTTLTKNTQVYSSKISKINSQINQIESIQKDNVIWSFFIEKLFNKSGDDITIRQIRIDQNTKTLVITGIAKTRDGLLSLKDNLDKMDYLSNIEFPIKNLLNKNDIDFEISAKFKSYDFTQP